MELKLWDHQVECIARAKDLDYFALLMDPGVGKSATVINILRDKFLKHGAILPTIILTPPVVIPNWKREIMMWSKVKSENILLLTGTGKERFEKLKQATPNTIVVTNYEALNMPDVFEEMLFFMSRGPSCLILDESHRCKDISSKRTKRAIELSAKANYRYLLTGTPILNSLMDIFSQFLILDQGERFGRNFFSFRARYFEDKNRFMPAKSHFPNWAPIQDADVKIKALIEPVSMHVEKSTCLTLPPFVRKVIEVPMSKEQAKMYEDMRKDLIATISTGQGDRHSIAELAITKALRLQQIVSGHLKVEGVEALDERVIKIKDNPRKKALKEVLEDLVPYHKVIVWSVFKDNYTDIKDVCTELDVEFTELHGEVKDRQPAIDRFNTDPRCRVLVGHPGSGGIGVSLIAASYMVYYSRSFSLEFDVQSEARAYRGGSEIHQSITRIDLVTPGTIDEMVMKALANKTAISNSVLKEKLSEI
jgi:SNF2 family DNA or RNA helicase